MTKKLVALSVLLFALLPLACSSGGDDSGGGGGIRMTVKKQGLEEAVERARLVADELGGFVARSSSSLARRGQPQQASIVIRVPNPELFRRSCLAVGRGTGRSPAGGRGGRLPEVRRPRGSRAAPAGCRAPDARAPEQGADGPGRARGTGSSERNPARAREVRGRLRFLEVQKSYATISLSVRERGPVAPVAGDGGWGIVEAWKDGAQAFVGVAGRVFVVLAGVAPLILLAALAFLALRAARRRSLFGWGAPRPQ